MSSFTLRSSFLLATSGIAFAASPAMAQKSEVHPYIEVQQVLESDLQDGDTLTYTNVQVGVDGSIQTQRTQVQASVNYQHTFGYDNGMSDSDTVSGIIRGQTQIVPGVLNLEGGAIATRARADGRGLVAGNLSGDQSNTASVFSGYIGPQVQTNIGNVGVAAGYRFGYTQVGEQRDGNLPTGAAQLDQFDHSTSHSASLSVGQTPGSLPIGWQVSGAWEREDMSQLDQRYEGKYARADITVPVSRSVALVGGVGYENIEISGRDAVRDSSGAPVLDSNGRYVTDKSSPRTIAYQTDGLIYDAGVQWKPSPRTSFEARVGRRYDSTTYSATGSWQFSPSAGFALSIYDGVESFGRQMNDTLSRIPTSYNVANGGLGNNYGGCVYGQNGNGGGCFNSAFSSIQSANFRSRGIQAMLSGGRGRSSWGIGAGYQRNKFLMPDYAGLPIDRTVDQLWYIQGNQSYSFNDRSSLAVSGYASWYDNGLAGAPTVFGLGTDVGYSYNISRNFSARASGGVYYSDASQYGDSVIGTALIALRYGL